jgi:hypothetical protein
MFDRVVLRQSFPSIERALTSFVWAREVADLPVSFSKRLAVFGDVVATEHFAPNEPLFTACRTD